jgi:hypothetical protein
MTFDPLAYLVHTIIGLARKLIALRASQVIADFPITRRDLDDRDILNDIILRAIDHETIPDATIDTYRRDMSMIASLAMDYIRELPHALSALPAHLMALAKSDDSCMKSWTSRIQACDEHINAESLEFARVCRKCACDVYGLAQTGPYFAMRRTNAIESIIRKITPTDLSHFGISTVSIMHFCHSFEHYCARGAPRDSIYLDIADANQLLAYVDRDLTRGLYIIREMQQAIASMRATRHVDSLPLPCSDMKRQ